MITEKVCPSCGIEFDPGNPNLVEYWVAAKSTEMLAQAQDHLRIALAALELSAQPEGFEHDLPILCACVFCKQREAIDLIKGRK